MDRPKETGEIDRGTEVDVDAPKRLAQVDPDVGVAEVGFNVTQSREKRIRQHDPGHALRRIECGVNADDAAEAMTDNERGLKSERGVQASEIVRHDGGSVTARGPAANAVPAQVVRRDAEIDRECID